MLIGLSNAPRDYAWGSATLLAEFEGRVPPGGPEAEVWFGDHPADPADLPAGGSLAALTGGRLPYLVKLLAAAAPLSIQAHPNRAQAAAGFARESALAPEDPTRSYRDANHKPELLVALSDRFEALAGLRALDETRRIVDALGDSQGVRALRMRLAASDDPLRHAVAWALGEATTPEISDVCAAVRAATVPGVQDSLAAVAGIAQRYPDDGGVLVALLMNHVVLRRGEGLFIPAGALHAYLSGLGIEVMAASDNVLRGGLTPKHVDVPELLSILDVAPGPAQVQTPDPAASDIDYVVPVSDFTMRRFRFADEVVEVTLAGPAILVATEGSVQVSSDAATLPIPVGHAIFADDSEHRVLLSGAGEVFVAQPG